MVNNVSNATQIQHAAQSTKVDTKSTHSKPKPTTSKPDAAAADTVKVSNAALAALQEATETTVQTDKEARSGDRQAQQLLAKQAAAKAAKK